MTNVEIAALISVLRTARDILATKTWGQHLEARDIYGNIVQATDPRADCFCLSGALRKAWFEQLQTLPPASVLEGLPVFRITQLICEGTGVPMPIVHWNDAKGRTKRDVLRLIDEAIKYWQAKEGA